MKHIHPCITEIFWMNKLIEDIQYHWFTPGNYFSKVYLVGRPPFLIMWCNFSSDQKIIWDDKEDQ